MGIIDATQAIAVAEAMIRDSGREPSSVTYVALMAVALEVFKAHNGARVASHRKAA